MDWSIEEYSTLGSTQDTLKHRIEEGAPERLAIHAFVQEGGRGRHGNKWISPEGNLYLSFHLKPRCAASRVGELAFVVALAAHSTLLQHGKGASAVQLKWPNDVLCNGLKIAGILLETNIKDDQSIDLFCGVGMNVCTPPDGTAGIYPGLNDPQMVRTVRDDFLGCMGREYSLWEKKGFAPVRERWLKLAYGLHQPMTARLPHRSVAGVFKGIDAGGALLLDHDGRIETIHAAEVHFGEIGEKEI